MYESVCVYCMLGAWCDDNLVGVRGLRVGGVGWGCVDGGVRGGGSGLGTRLMYTEHI